MAKKRRITLLSDQDRTEAFTPTSKKFRRAQIARAINRQAPAFVIVSVGFFIVTIAIDFTATQHIVAPLWLTVAGGAGLIAGFIRELQRDVVGALEKIERVGYSILGAAPQLTDRDLRTLPPDMRTPLGCMVCLPASAFAVATRDLQSEIAGNQVVAFIGSLPNEGASTAALCSAASARLEGLRTLVIDCDLRRRSLTRMMRQRPKTGVLEATKRPDDWRNAIIQEPETGVHLMCASPFANAWHNVFESPRFEHLLDLLRAEYDLIVLDCPPALTASDGALAARLADRCIVVMGWDETPIGALRATNRALRRVSTQGRELYVNRVPNRFRFERAAVA